MEQYNAGEILIIAAATAFAVAVQLGLGAWIYSILNKEG